MTILLAGVPATEFTKVLIGDNTAIAGGSVDGIPTSTLSGGVPISASLEIQSTQGGLQNAPMTTAQIAAIVTPYNGMQVFNTSNQTMMVYQNGAWSSTSSNAMGTTVMTSATFGGVASIYATPVTLIPAPGAGFVTVIDRLFMELIWPVAGGVQYANGGAVSLQYGTAAHAAGTLATGTIAAADINGAVASTLFTAAGVILGGTPGSLTATFANQPVSISNATGAFTAGNSSFNIYVYYRILAIT